MHVWLIEKSSMPGSQLLEKAYAEQGAAQLV
jgi:hypothetical protein